MAAPAPRVGSVASTAMRRRVLDSAALGEWALVREAVEVQGCSVNIQEEDTGFSLVHWAAQQGNAEALAWLAERGAFLRLKDKRGKPALAVAGGAFAAMLLERAYSPVERVVYTRGGPPTLERLESELGRLGPEALGEPLWDERGASLTAALAARHAAGFDAVPLLRWLAARGADLEAVDEERNALLHMVDFSFGAEVARPLLAWALSEALVRHMDQRNSDGDTPALLCAYGSPTGHDALSCLQLFEAAGADLALVGRGGVNLAMMLARYQGDGPWLGWCYSQAGVDPQDTCAKRRTVVDYIALHGQDESD